jgi:hypothetical protein
MTYANSSALGPSSIRSLRGTRALRTATTTIAAVRAVIPKIERVVLVNDVTISSRTRGPNRSGQPVLFGSNRTNRIESDLFFGQRAQAVFRPKKVKQAAYPN